MRKLVSHLKQISLSSLALTASVGFAQMDISQMEMGTSATGDHTPIESVSEFPYVQCMTIMHRGRDGLHETSQWKVFNLQKSFNSSGLKIERFGREKFIFAARGAGDTIETAEYEVDIMAEIGIDSNWVKTNGLGRNLNLTAKVSRKMNGVKQSLAVATGNSDVAVNPRYLFRASANDYVLPAFTMVLPEIHDYFDPDFSDSLMNDQDIALSLVDKGFNFALDAAKKKGLIPAQQVTAFNVICEARFRSQALPNSDQLIRSGGDGAACKGLIEEDIQFDGMDGLNLYQSIFERMPRRGQ